MEERETLYRVAYHNKDNGYKSFLMVWGIDAMDVLNRMAAIVGPGGEYALDSLTLQTKDGNPVIR